MKSKPPLRPKKAIEKIEASTSKREVTEVNSPIHDDLVKYILSDDTEIISTFDHPFYVNGLKLASYRPKWTNERYDISLEVTQINIGDKLAKPNREILEIVSITELERINTQTYIISVDGNKKLPMTRFELLISGVKNDRSTK